VVAVLIQYSGISKKPNKETFAVTESATGGEVEWKGEGSRITKAWAWNGNIGNGTNNGELSGSMTRRGESQNELQANETH